MDLYISKNYLINANMHFSLKYKNNKTILQKERINQMFTSSNVLANIIEYDQ